MSGRRLLGTSTLDAVPKKYRELHAALREAGWKVLRQRGSHEVWGKPGESGRIVVAGKNSDAVPGRDAG